MTSWKELHLEVATARANHKAFVSAAFGSLMDALAIRNSICHGTLDLHGSKTGEREHVHIVTEMNGTKRTISIDEINSATQLVDQLARFMRDITWLAKQPSGDAPEKEYARARGNKF